MLIYFSVKIFSQWIEFFCDFDPNGIWIFKNRFYRRVLGLIGFHLYFPKNAFNMPIHLHHNTWEII